MDKDFTPKFDIKANRNFYAIAPSTVTPISQIEPLGFLCDIENVGLDSVTNANINISIKDSDETQLHSDSLFFDTIPSGVLVQNEIFDNVWTPPNIEGVYSGLYKVTIEEDDEKPENNEISFNYIISDSVFAKAVSYTHLTLPTICSV